MAVMLVNDMTSIIRLSTSILMAFTFWTTAVSLGAILDMLQSSQLFLETRFEAVVHTAEAGVQSFITLILGNSGLPIPLFLSADKYRKQVIPEKKPLSEVTYEGCGSPICRMMAWEVLLNVSYRMKKSLDPWSKRESFPNEICGLTTHLVLGINWKAHVHSIFGWLIPPGDECNLSSLHQYTCQTIDP